jgi:hypothetical protein
MRISQNQFDLLDEISPHLVPIVYKENGFMKPLGSSVYIKKANAHFLITALHVVESKKREEIFIPFKENYFLNIPAKRKLVINHPEVDLCIYPLEEIPDTYIPIDYSSIGNCSGMGKEVLLAGYPASRTKTYNKKIAFEMRFILTKVIKHEGFFDAFNEKANYVCNFKQKKILNGSGTICRFPDPWGMSGGAMFEIWSEPGKKEMSYKLSGIMTDWNPKERKYIKCTKISIACCAIDEVLA